MDFTIRKSLDNKLGVLLKLRINLSWLAEGDGWKEEPTGADLFTRMVYYIICNPENWSTVRELLVERIGRLKAFEKKIAKRRVAIGSSAYFKLCHEWRREVEWYGNNEMFNLPTKEELEQMIEYAGWMIVCGDRIAEERKAEGDVKVAEDVGDVNGGDVNGTDMTECRRVISKIEAVKEKVDWNVEHECFRSKLYDRDVDFFNRLYDFLLGLGLIEKGNKTNFKRLFGGENTMVRWKWLGGTYELYVLMKMLVKYGVIGENRYFAIAAECFYFEGDVKIYVGSCNKGNDDLKKSICGFFKKEFQRG